MNEELYFLKEDLEALDAKIGELRSKLEETLKEGGESTRQSSETWHDNFPFEEAQRQFSLLAGQLQKLVDIRKKAKLVDSAASNDKVIIGSMVTIRDESSDQLKIFKTGSFMVFSNDGGRTISYNSPLAQIVIGAKIGEVRSGKIGIAEKSFKIIKIE